VPVRLILNGGEIPAVVLPVSMLALCVLSWYYGRFERWYERQRREHKERAEEARKRYRMFD
jgi:hypothetical protein